MSDGFRVPLWYAVQMASRFKAKLFLVHVVDSSVDNPMSSLSSELRDTAASAKAELKRISESVPAAAGITTEVLVRFGNVRDVIFDLQQECKADLVVVGSTGKKPGHGKAAGSVAEAILRSMPCMVLAVGPEVEERPYPGHGGTVLFPTDLSSPSLDALPVAVSVASASFATLFVLHICGTHVPDMLPEKETIGRQRLQEIVASVPTVSAKIEQTVGEGTVADEILSFAKKRDVGSIVMSVHHGDLDDGTRLRGIVSDVIRRAHCPVLSVPEQQS